MTATCLTVRDLRRMWRPHKERLNVERAQHPTNIRFHRACSWLQAAERLVEQDELDLQIINLWIAFNALYGQWNHADREPMPDRECWKVFLERMLELDRNRHLAQLLTARRSAVMSLFRDRFLNRFFWKDAEKLLDAGDPGGPVFEARIWYDRANWFAILEKLTDRLYFFRCQLVHGGSTCNSSFNRKAAEPCAEMLDALLRSFLLIWAEWGVDEDWGILCYPPLGVSPAGEASQASGGAHAPIEAPAPPAVTSGILRPR